MTTFDPNPWAAWSPGTVHFCEAGLHAWVREPANAWSSLAYVAAAALMAARRQPATVVAAQLMIGAGSFFFHASETFAGEITDQAGMYLLAALMIAFPRAVSLRSKGLSVAAVTFGITAASVGINLVARPIGIPLFAAELLFGLREVFRVRRRMDPSVGRDLSVALGLFAVSFAVWLTDISRLICDPDRHLITGHAVWHVLNATAIFFLGRFLQRAEAAVGADGAAVSPATA